MFTQDCRKLFNCFGAETHKAPPCSVYCIFGLFLNPLAQLHQYWKYMYSRDFIRQSDLINAYCSFFRCHFGELQLPTTVIWLSLIWPSKIAWADVYWGPVLVKWRQLSQSILFSPLPAIMGYCPVYFICRASAVYTQYIIKPTQWQSL